MAKKPKPKTAALEAPQDQDQAARAIADYGRALRALAGIKAEMDNAIAAITEQYQASVTTQEAEVERLLAAVHAYCEANRATLTRGGEVKFVQFTTGTAEWRKDQDKVTAPNKAENLQTVVELLTQRGLSRFVRVKSEVNKEAMLAEKKTLPSLISGIPGLTFAVGKESFSITPLESEL